MPRRWTPKERLELIERFSKRSGADSAAFFDAHGLGVSFRRPGDKSSKKAKIVSALSACDARGDTSEVLEAIHAYLDNESLREGPSVRTTVDAAIPHPQSEDEHALLQAVWDSFTSTGNWPTFREVDARLDRVYKSDALALGRTMPDGLILPSGFAWPPSDEVKLTIAGANACIGTEELLSYFVQAVALAAQLERNQNASSNEDVAFDSEDLKRELALPAAGRSDFLLRLGKLLAVENWGWSSASWGGNDGNTWQFRISRNIRRLRDVATIEQYWRATHPEPTGSPIAKDPAMPGAASKIFLVHGHDAAKHEVARFLERVLVSSELIILSEQANSGKTVIEKFEAHGSTTAYAVVLLTPDDLGRAVDVSVESPRARQNVVFELGYFYGKLGRGAVAVLNKGHVEKPSDIGGIAWIDFPTGDWKLQLSRELEAAGIKVDLSKAP